MASLPRCSYWYTPYLLLLSRISPPRRFACCAAPHVAIWIYRFRLRMTRGIMLPGYGSRNTICLCPGLMQRDKTHNQSETGSDIGNNVSGEVCLRFYVVRYHWIAQISLKLTDTWGESYWRICTRIGYCEHRWNLKTTHPGDAGYLRGYFTAMMLFVCFFVFCCCCFCLFVCLVVVVVFAF